MKKNTLNLFSVLVLIICSITQGHSQTMSSKFAGKWVINYEKSDFGNIPRYVICKEAVVLPGANNVTLKLTMLTPNDADSSATRTLPIGGEIKEISPDDKRQRAIAAKVSTLGDTLRIITVASIPNNYTVNNYKMDETWTISNDGKTLSIRKTVVPATEGVNYTVTAIYNRE